MNLSVGEKVVYCSSEVCTCEGQEKRSFDGKHENLYYKLVPLASPKSSYYVPADGVGAKIRALLSRSEVEDIINGIPQIEPIWFAEASERKKAFHNMLRSDDCNEVLRLIKSIHERQHMLFEMGRKLSSADEMIMRAAEDKICQEFATVLNIPQDKMKDCINEKI